MIRIKGMDIRLSGGKAYKVPGKDLSGGRRKENQEFSAGLSMIPAGEGTAVFVEVSLKEGTLDGACAVSLELELPETAFLADYRHKEYWCSPFFCKSADEIPDQTQALLWKEGELFRYLLPVCSGQYKAVMKGDRLRLGSGYDGLSACSVLAFVWGEGKKPYRLAERVTETAFSLLPGGMRGRTGRRYPEVFEYLGWCSWDAFQIRVSEEGLLAKCKEFAEKKIPVRWAVIDDMWEDVKGLYDLENPDYETVFENRHNTKLASFEADPYRFPGGLARCVRRMKEEYGIQAGVWHTINGYWKGVDETGKLAEEYHDCLMKGSSGQLVPDWHFEKAFRYYEGWHRFLKECGVAFVKIDNQSTLERNYGGKAPIGEVAENLHRAIEASTGLYFDQAVINCMGMAGENMWNRPATAVSRCSDDFLPENREWFTKHILQCSYNSLVQGNFLWCDWDMWWTSDGQALKNSLLRAVSGGPVYVSDRLGESRKEILEPLVLSDGKVLRCDRPGVPAADCLLEDPVESGKPFKVYSTCGNSAAVAVFNLDEGEKPVEGSLGTQELEMEETKVLAWESLSAGWKVLEKGEREAIRLENRDDFRFYLMIPLEEGFTPVGLKGKWIAPKTIEGRKGNTVILKEGGTFLFYSDQKISHAVVNGREEKVPDEKAPLYEICCETDGPWSVSIFQQAED